MSVVGRGGAKVTQRERKRVPDTMVRGQRKTQPALR